MVYLPFGAIQLYWFARKLNLLTKEGDPLDYNNTNYLPDAGYPVMSYYTTNMTGQRVSIAGSIDSQDVFIRHHGSYESQGPNCVSIDPGKLHVADLECRLRRGQRWRYGVGRRVDLWRDK